MIGERVYQSLTYEELLNKQQEAAEQLVVARAWASDWVNGERKAAHAGITGNNWPLVHAMEEVCRIAIEIMCRDDPLSDRKKLDAALEVVALARDCRKFVANGDAERAANTAANAAATFYSYGISAFAEEMKERAEALKRESDNKQVLKKQESKKGGEESAKTRARKKERKAKIVIQMYWELKEKGLSDRNIISPIANGFSKRADGETIGRSTVIGYLEEAGIIKK